MQEPTRRYRFGPFEADLDTGELRRKGIRVRLHSQPFRLLGMLLERPGQMVTREEIRQELWPQGTFVDFDHGVNSAVNRLRDALGDRARTPRFVETLARRGYRFVAPVEPISSGDRQSLLTVASEPAVGLDNDPVKGVLDRVLAGRSDLPRTSPEVVQSLFLLLQVMYLSFYVGALANLAEINELLSPLSLAEWIFAVIIFTAVLLIPVRIFLICAAIFRAPSFGERFRKVWPFLLIADALWSVSPFLLLHHISYGLALACMTPLVYSPFAQRSLILMGAGRPTT